MLRVQHLMKLPALGSLALLVLHRPRFSSVGRPQGISWWCSLLGSSTLLLVQCRIHTAIQHQSIFSLQSTVVLGNLQLNKRESALKGLTNLSCPCVHFKWCPAGHIIGQIPNNSVPWAPHFSACLITLGMGGGPHQLLSPCQSTVNP